MPPPTTAPVALPAPTDGTGRFGRDQAGRRRFWLMVALAVAAPLATLMSWGITIERGLPDDWTALLMLVDAVLAVIALVLLPRVLHRDSGPPRWAIDPQREAAALRWGLLVIACSAFSGGAFLPALVTVASLSARRRPRWIAAAALLLLGVFAVSMLLEGQSSLGGDLLPLALTAVGLTVVLVLMGLYRGSRRALLHALRREAQAAQASQVARADQARAAERTRIAREMHDTVSHRLALVALHAGGLEYRDDLTPEQVRSAMGTIRQAVQEASEELANTLAVLRSDGGDVIPAPRMADVHEVIAAVTQAGADVTTELSLPDLEPPATVIAHLHRVVQESLTNALKHAAGEPITVSIQGAPADGIQVVVRNPVPDHTVVAMGSRVGLVGLRERLALAGGTFEARRQGQDFVVQAWLPWQR